MKQYCIVFLTVFPLSTLLAQGTYPLQIGNVWQYRDSYDSTYGWTNTATKDTIMPNGLSYVKMMTDYQGETYAGAYRQDGSKVYYYGRNPSSDSTFQDYENLWYDYSKTTGDTVRLTIQDNPPDTIRVMVIDDFMLNIFGKIRRTWIFFEESRRTSGYVLREVADSIGLIHEEGEGGTAFNLSGAIINGTKYGTILGVQTQSTSAITSYELLQNYPNPFNSSTTISFTLPQRDHISLTIYNLLGQVVVNVAEGNYSKGEHQIHWDFGNASSGIYFYRLQTRDYTQTKKLILLK